MIAVSECQGSLDLVPMDPNMAVKLPATSHIFMGEILPLMDGLLVAKEEGCQMVKEGVAVARYSSL